MPSIKVPSDVPEDLRYLALRLSWDDAAHLLCLYEGWFMESQSCEHRAKARKLAEQMRTLVRALPYDWSPPPVEEHTLVTALATWVRTGKMPPAPPGYVPC